MQRRTFLNLGFASTAALAAPAMATPVAMPQKWDEAYDVVIVGAGGAGLAAATQAVMSKLSAVVFEKEPVEGGSSAICGGQWAVGGTPEQEKRGIKDSEDLFFNDMMTTGKHQNDPDVVRAYVKESKALYTWVTTELGVKPISVTLSGGMSVPRAHTFKPAEVIQAYKKYATGHGVKLVTRAKVERLVWDFQKQEIAGVRVTVRNKTLFVKANKGVVLAAGGFSRNPKMLKKYAPLLENAAVIAGLGTQGDGILMAQAYGADMIDTNYIKASYGFTLKPSTIHDMALTQFKGAILINKFGKRFVDESISYKIQADVAFAQPEGKSWMVFDDAIRRTAMKLDPMQDGILWKPIDEGKVPPYVFMGNTIEEAAQKAGLDPKAVAETVARYNKAVETGNDTEFGRKGLASGKGKLVKIEKAPFFIFPSVGAMIGTYCGIRISPKAEVIDVFGEKIPHLYAAGEMTGGVHGASYMTGTAFSKAMCFGRIAVRSIAAQK
ncbi:MAG: FAD-binding-2 domain-containing protein [Burkholderia sp.]|jgi:fumarate reductase flavoprotein subunit